MSLILGIDSRQMEFSSQSITIGRSPTSQLSIADPRLSEQHAVLKQVAGRWLIEAVGETAIRVGDGRPSKIAWLNPGDVISLTETGPTLTFSPVVASAPIAVPTPPVERLPEISLPVVNVAPPPVASPAVSPSPTSKQLHPALWAIGGAGLVLMSVVLTLVMMPNRSETQSSPDPSPHEVSMESPIDQTRKDHTVHSSVTSPLEKTPEKTHGPITESSPEQIEAAIYLLMLNAADLDRTNRLGTAWAVAPRQLVTSAVVGEAILNSREDSMTALARNSGLDRPVEITNVTLDPEYRRISEEVSDTAANLDDLLEEWDEASDEEQKSQLSPKISDAQKHYLDCYQQLLDCNLAVLSVNQDLSTTLPVSDLKGSVARAGSSVHLWGFPIHKNDLLVDPDEQQRPLSRTGKIDSKVPVQGTEIRRWIVRFTDLSPEEIWSGSPVVNQQGQAIGVYATPTPPVENVENYVPTTHQVTAISRLSEILRTKR